MKHNFKYAVINENTLGYFLRHCVFENIFVTGYSYYGVLSVSILRGGVHAHLMNGSIHVAPSDVIRQATKEDFEFFRVDSKGYDLNETI